MKAVSKTLFDIEEYSTSLLKYINYKQHKTKSSLDNSTYLMCSLTEDPSELSFNCFESTYKEIHKIQDFLNLPKNKLGFCKSLNDNHKEMAVSYCLKCNKSFCRECSLEHKNHFLFEDEFCEYNSFENKKKNTQETEYNSFSTMLLQEYGKFMALTKQKLCNLRKQKEKIINILQKYISIIENTFQKLNTLHKQKFKLLDYYISTLEQPNLVNLINFVNVVKTCGFSVSEFKINPESFTSQNIKDFIDYLKNFEPKTMEIPNNFCFKIIFGKVTLMFPFSIVNPLDCKYYFDLSKTDFFIENFKGLERNITQDYEKHIRSIFELLLKKTNPELLDQLDKKHFNGLNPSDVLTHFQKHLIKASPKKKITENLLNIIESKITIILKESTYYTEIPIYLLFYFSLVKRINSQSEFMKKLIKAIMKYEFQEKTELITKRFEMLYHVIKNNNFIFSKISEFENEYSKVKNNTEILLSIIKTLLFIEQPFDSFLSKAKEMSYILNEIDIKNLEDPTILQIYLDYFELFIAYEENKQKCIIALFSFMRSKTIKSKLDILPLKWLFMQLKTFNISFSSLPLSITNNFASILDQIYNYNEYEYLANIVISFSSKRELVNELMSYFESRNIFNRISKKTDIPSIKLQFAAFYNRLIYEYENDNRHIKTAIKIHINPENQKVYNNLYDVHTLLSYLHPKLRKVAIKKNSQLSKIYVQIEEEAIDIFPTLELCLQQNTKNIYDEINYFSKKIIQKDNAFYALDVQDIFTSSKPLLYQKIQSIGKYFKSQVAKILYCAVPTNANFSDSFIRDNSLIFFERQIKSTYYEYVFKGFVTLDTYNKRNVYFYNKYTVSWFSFSDKKYLNNIDFGNEMKSIYMIYFRRKHNSCLEEFYTSSKINSGTYINPNDVKVYTTAFTEIYKINSKIIEMNLDFLYNLYDLDSYENFINIYQSIQKVCSLDEDINGKRIIFMMLSKGKLKDINNEVISNLKDKYFLIPQTKLINTIKSFDENNGKCDPFEIDKLVCNIEYYVNNLTSLNIISEQLASLLCILLILTFFPDQGESQHYDNLFYNILGKRLIIHKMKILLISFRKNVNKYISDIQEYSCILFKDNSMKEGKITRFYLQLLLFYILCIVPNEEILSMFLYDLFNQHHFCYQLNPDPEYTKEEKNGLLILYSIIKGKLKESYPDTFNSLSKVIFEFKPVGSIDNTPYYSILQKLSIKDYIRFKINNAFMGLHDKIKNERINACLENVIKNCLDFQTVFFSEFYFDLCQIEQEKQKISQIDISNYLQKYPQNNLGIFLLFLFLNKQQGNNSNSLLIRDDEQNQINIAYNEFNKHNETKYITDIIKKNFGYINNAEISYEISYINKLLNEAKFLFLQASEYDCLLTSFNVSEMLEDVPILVLNAKYLNKEGQFDDEQKISFTFPSQSTYKLRGAIIISSEEKFIFIVNRYNEYAYSITENKWVSSIRYHLRNNVSIQEIILIYFYDKTDDNLNPYIYSPLIRTEIIECNLAQQIVKWYLNNNIILLLKRKKSFSEMFQLKNNDIFKSVEFDWREDNLKELKESFNSVLNFSLSRKK